MAFAQAVCSLSRARNGHSMRLDNFAYKLKIVICALFIACTDKKKSTRLYKKCFYEGIISKNAILKGIVVFSCCLYVRNQILVFKKRCWEP